FVIRHAPTPTGPSSLSLHDALPIYRRGLRPEARLLVGRQPRRRVATRLSTRRGAAGRRDAGARGILPLRHGRALFGGCRAAAVLAAQGLHGDRPAGREPADPERGVPLYRRAARDGAGAEPRR